ncbi:acyl-CoA dehydrogenase family protein [Actinomadura sp. ATCC 31491]|uniref:Acyl-CoA dehydrogenase family protein n=1 Tax=Actinomadura luzonensis TaxID=2805427 RepID=A0ABT0G4J7_9ACTN|nr:acyl-CoA dehydrogenase [Actinomadura luzonensis]MCK2219536.1 acyl-CoA dehydrogenase family protein [Actinomadura luzonensis]
MNFAFTDEQLALGATVRDVLRDACPPSALRALSPPGASDLPGPAGPPGPPGGGRRPGWGPLAGLGFFGLLLPPEHDGLGLGLADVLPALEETGRACLPGPVAETAVAAPFLVAGAPKLASGEVSVSVLAPGQAYAADADLADLIVVAGPDGTRLVAREAARLTPRPGADPCRPLFAVAYEESEPLDVPLAPALDRLTVATAAQLVGVAKELLAVSVAYARVRTQFGAPIGSFQAVKHRLADVAVAVEFAAPLVWRAALALDGGAPTARRDVSAAKAAAGEAAVLAAGCALQVHGAIGYTEELDLRFWLARAWSLAVAYGTSAAHRARLRAALLGGDVRRWP